MKKADAIVAMGGYNTFCEILSFDKRALIVPRTRPRLEQYIRAVRSRAARPRAHAERLRARRAAGSAWPPALRSLSSQPRPRR